MRFWMSWACNGEDFRPLTYPPHDAICGWWCSGYDADSNAILCAVVDAENEGKAMEAIFREWPEAKSYTEEFDFRFIERRANDWIPGDRFPKKDGWMLQRLTPDGSEIGNLTECLVMSEAAETTQAVRGFCYRWTCRCGHENRMSDCRPGTSYACGNCHAWTIVDSVLFDNGAVMVAYQDDDLTSTEG